MLHVLAEQPVAFKNIILPRRIVRSATEFFCSTENGHLVQKEIDIFQRLSEQPVGMILTGHTAVAPEGRTRGQNAIFGDEYIEENCRLAEVAKRHGVRCVMQLGHGGRKAEGQNGGLRVLTPDTMTVSDIQNTVKAFTDAAVRAKICGFDGVEIHGAHRYLLSEFFYPQFNHRTDAYGGSAENRFRIIYEIISAIKVANGADFPVFLKINSDNVEAPEKYFRDLCAVAEICEKTGVEGMELSGWDCQPAGTPKEPYFFHTARRLYHETTLPLMLVGGIRKATEIEEILAFGIKTVSLCRPFMKNPSCLTDIYGAEFGV